MVELYELKLMPIDADNCWPPDIDQHVAQLDFGTSMMMDGQSIFGSLMVDPTVSTDSLDMDTMLRRCQDNKNNDYKLTFEDSGQWTTSGIGGSFTTTTNTTTASPPMRESRRVLKMLRNKGNNNSILHHDRDNHNLSLKLLEELNNGGGASSDEDDELGQHRQRSAKIKAMDWRDKLFDEILNNNGTAGKSTNDQNNATPTTNGFGEFTTWSRISRKSVETMQPFNSDNVNSLPELNENNKNCPQEDGVGGYYSSKANSSPTIGRNHPAKLSEAEKSGESKRAAGNLVTNFMENFKSKDDDEEEPQPMDYEYSEVYLGNGRYIDMNDNEIGFVPPSTAAIQRRNGPNVNCRRSESAVNGLKSNSPRTFADLSPSRTAPDLKFIALSHKVPSICNSSTSFENLLKKAKSGNFNEMLQCCAGSERIVSENVGGGGSVDESDGIPDSGLGSSHSEGPSHIEDWPSLSILLPRSVVDACSFFKSNNFLLSGSSNSIERRSPPLPSHPPRSFTSTGIRRLSRWAESVEDHHHQHHRPATSCCPNCLSGGSSTMNSADGGDICRSAILLQSRHRTDQLATQKMRLHAKELAMIGLPLYDQKRNLVERVVEGVAEVLRGGSCIVLLAALEKLLEDGLKMGKKPWEVVRGVTGPGPVTASVFQLIMDLEAIEKPGNSRISHFLQGLVTLHSLDGWFSYIVLKENVLRQFYVESAFFIGAHTTYRSLFARFVECLELLSVLNQCGMRKKMQQKRKQFSMNSIEAAKMPSDSRIPKSSSMPTKLTKTTMDEEKKVTIDSDLATKNVPEIVEPAEGHQQNNEIPKQSKIPILRSRSKSNSLLKRSHSSSLRTTPTRVCQVAEAVDENECRLGTVLPAQKGESVRVLSVRGLYSRCARFGSNLRRGNLTIQNGILPTKKLVVMDEK